MSSFKKLCEHTCNENCPGPWFLDYSITKNGESIQLFGRLSCKIKWHLIDYRLDVNGKQEGRLERENKFNDAYTMFLKRAGLETRRDEDIYYLDKKTGAIYDIARSGLKGNHLIERVKV